MASTTTPYGEYIASTSRSSQDLMAPPTANEHRPLRLLSLDGGGVRGLSTIIILKAIMRSLRRHLRRPTAEPWEVFDMIGGTSTGGLIAVMLGRLRMSLQECENAYLTISERIFNPKRYNVNFIGRAKDFLLADGKFDCKVLEDAIKEIITDKAGKLEAELFKDPDPRCKVFVAATRVSNSQLAILRSYDNDSDLPLTLFDECKVWEACRATSAAPTFFDSVKIGPYRQEFVDGGLNYNNPVDLLYREAAATWPDRIDDATFLSIGTGSAPGGRFEGNIKNIIEAMKEIVTQTERTGDDFYFNHRDIVRRGAYFRFNVYHGLGDVGLEEYAETAKMADATEHYLSTGEVRQKMSTCTHLLGQGGLTIDE